MACLSSTSSEGSHAHLFSTCFPLSPSTSSSASFFFAFSLVFCARAQRPLVCKSRGQGGREARREEKEQTRRRGGGGGRRKPVAGESQSFSNKQGKKTAIERRAPLVPGALHGPCPHAQCDLCNLLSSCERPKAELGEPEHPTARGISSKQKGGREREKESKKQVRHNLFSLIASSSASSGASTPIP